MFNKHTKIYISICFSLVLLSNSQFSTAFASGAFSPFSGSFGSEQFNKGKAIYSGRAGNTACTSCHRKFRRSKLRKLETSVAEYVSNCEIHTPCFNNLSMDQKVSLNAYFNRRYHLK